MPVTKGHIWCDFIHMNYLEQSNLERQKVEWWLPGAEDRMKISGDGHVNGCTTMWRYFMPLNCTPKND